MVKLHVSACNGHHQVSTPIKKSLYICVRACWWRDLYASIPSLFYCLVQIAIYNQHKKYFQNVVWAQVFLLGAAQTLAYHDCRLFLGGTLNNLH